MASKIPPREAILGGSLRWLTECSSCFTSKTVPSLKVHLIISVSGEVPLTSSALESAVQKCGKEGSLIKCQTAASGAEMRADSETEVDVGIRDAIFESWLLEILWSVSSSQCSGGRGGLYVIEDEREARKSCQTCAFICQARLPACSQPSCLSMSDVMVSGKSSLTWGSAGLDRQGLVVHQQAFELFQFVLKQILHCSDSESFQSSCL